MIHPQVARIIDQQPGLLQPNGRSRRCYLLRGNLAARRKLERHCTNEPTLSGVAQIEFGCEIVYPENLGWLEQVALFRSSSLVVGLIGSALHTSVMASDKPTVAFVGLNAMAQPQVARLRHQRYAVLDKDIDARGSYVVSVPAFRRLMEAVS
jgi:capsular polysaccharide biosynthesis protein